ncbi:BaiN/RdsA family NAD(P)/FAD-dependent oxidoreductase [Campylobacter portucalensis]|uniref:NAD(P)/FAD-dependent oxidoreductase n=1 Tax=Campylobacter portucalensis TaxID=2608384 RepID=UPI0012B2AFA7|nr:aminoacetone oxidase family FAD-binding enzyme [Campylobacter portucalensis]
MIIGGGASGLFLGANLKGKRVLILEKNEKLGKKILISGGGKCNITNEFVNKLNYNGDEILFDLLKSSEILDFFGAKNFIKIKNFQYFCKNGSNFVLKTLIDKNKFTKINLNSEVIDVKKDKNLFCIFTKNEKFLAKNLVVASGGLSYPSLGVSDIAYKIALKFGLNLSVLKPALVGFTVQKDEFWFKNLSGVSTFVEILVDDRKIRGDMLFTHKGLSGPAILNASLFWDKGKMMLNFLPNFDFKTIKSSKKQISTNLPLPKRFIKEFLEICDIRDKVFCDLNSDELCRLSRIFNYEFAPAGTFGYTKAEITKGGVSLRCLDENLQSKDHLGLFFIGEALNFNGMLGGYNLHFAFSSAIRVAKFLNFSI